MPGKILVVENDVSLRSKLCDVLFRSGYNAAGVADYFDAICMLDTFKPDLAIIDVELPLVDGWEACLETRQGYDIPVILIGDDIGVEAWVKALEYGADFYCKMPIGYLELPARVKTILWRHQRHYGSTTHS